MTARFATVLTVIMFIGAVMLSGQQGPSGLDARIIELERTVLGAFATDDAAGFRRHLAEESFGIDAFSGVVKAADWVAMMKDVNVESWSIDNVRVHWANKETAIVTYRWMAKGTAMGQPLPNPTWAA